MYDIAKQATYDRPSRIELEELRDIENIICCLQNMSLEDPSYVALYHRAFKMDRDIAYVIQPPKDNYQNIVSSHLTPSHPVI